MWGKKEETGSMPSQEPSSPTSASAAPQPVRPSSSPAPAPKPVPTSGAKAQSQIGKSLIVKGDIEGKEDLVIDGQVEGKIALPDNNLTIGPNGTVKADVDALNITVIGRLMGNVRAAERIEIRKTGSLEADLSTARIVIEDGAEFRGSIDILKPGQKPASRPGAAKSEASDNGKSDANGKNA